MALRQNTKDYVVRGICFQNGIHSSFEVLKDRGETEAGLKFLKQLLTVGCLFYRGFISTLFVGNRFWVIRFDGFLQVE